jgi:hypothetical protein
MTGSEYRKYITQSNVEGWKGDLEGVNPWNFFFWPWYSDSNNTSYF